MPAHKIPMETITSSNLDAMGYDADARTLAIGFQSGHIHHYFGVPEEIVHDLILAESKGRYYAQFIKGKFTSEKMTGKCDACGDIGWLGDECTDCGTRHYARAA